MLGRGQPLPGSKVREGLGGLLSPPYLCHCSLVGASGLPFS